MKTAIHFSGIVLMAIGGHLFLSSFIGGGLQFPYRQAGLTERQAAAHLISRFTYGATPGQVDAVVHIGLENWFRQQLEGGIPDDSLQQCLSRYDALTLSNEEVVKTYPRNGQLIRMAIRDGYVDKDSVRADRKAYREVLKEYMQEKGYKPEQELIRQFINQKVLRAAYSNNQLQEVMTDFWFNHFNVSITKNDCSSFIPAYERDVIRPGALGHFDDLLLHTAKSPAMLYYLDNFSSASPAPDMSGMGGRRGKNADLAIAGQGDSALGAALVKARKARGLNENYAREVMELHTLGVDGGYTQQDVTQAARVLTGWTVYPMQKEGKNLVNQIGEEKMARRGFVHEGDFLFNANRHDNGEKVVLGRHFGPNGGYQEGVDLLEMLAQQSATARFITRKIAVRFVSDDPPQTLLDKMVRTFIDRKGDIRQVLITMVSSPEFWSTGALREKTKSPFELAIGAVRALNGRIDQPYQLYNWVAKMGEKKYYYQAPTGFPDKGAYWINTGALLYRMNFGLALASGRIPGVIIDLEALNGHHEPESAQSALAIYGRLIMPERNLDETIRRLTPLLNDPNLEKVAVNGDGHATNQGGFAMNGDMYAETKMHDSPMLSRVVGIIIGSPEYQRR